MIWFIVIIVIFIVNKVISEHKQDVNHYITSQGGMMTKYSTLVDYLKEAGLTLSKLSSDTIIMTSNIVKCRLDFVAPNLEVTFDGQVPTKGLFHKRWTYPSGYPQEKMIEELNNYFDYLTESAFGISREDIDNSFSEKKLYEISAELFPSISPVVWESIRNNVKSGNIEFASNWAYEQFVYLFDDAYYYNKSMTALDELSLSMKSLSVEAAKIKFNTEKFIFTMFRKTNEATGQVETQYCKDAEGKTITYIDASGAEKPLPIVAVRDTAKNIIAFCSAAVAKTKILGGSALEGAYFQPSINAEGQVVYQLRRTKIAQLKEDYLKNDDYRKCCGLPANEYGEIVNRAYSDVVTKYSI